MACIHWNGVVDFKFRVSNRISNFKTKNATHCDNRDDLLRLSFILKISTFSEANPVENLWWSFYCENSKPLIYSQKKLHRRCLLGVLNTSLLLIEDSSNVFISLKYFIFKVFYIKTLEICYFVKVINFF